MGEVQTKLTTKQLLQMAADRGAAQAKGSGFSGSKDDMAKSGDDFKKSEQAKQISLPNTIPNEEDAKITLTQERGVTLLHWLEPMKFPFDIQPKVAELQSAITMNVLSAPLQDGVERILAICQIGNPNEKLSGFNPDPLVLTEQQKASIKQIVDISLRKAENDSEAVNS